MATAVASGAAAAVISARPYLTATDAKTALVSSAYQSAGLSDVFAAGAGGLDLAAALTVAVPADRGGSGRPGLPPDALAPDTAGQWSSLSWKSLSWKSLSWKSLSWKSLSWKAQDWASLSWKSSAWAGLWR